MGFAETIENFSHTQILTEQPMKKFTSMGVGGNAKYFARPTTLYSLNQLITLSKKHKVPYRIIGNGTNIIVSDKGYNGLIICLNKLSDVFFKRDMVKAMAGVSIDKVIKFCLEHRLSGLETLSGIPATVGGAVVMNAGAFGKTISDHIYSVDVLSNGKIKTYDKHACKFSYRKSRFLTSKETVVSATFSFPNGSKEFLETSIKNFADLRRNLQPLGKSSGSVFKNPKSNSAGFLIENAGLKGYRIGGAEVSEKHANFIINTAKASANDVFSLTKVIKDSVKGKFGVDLKEEVEFIGEF